MAVTTNRWDVQETIVRIVRAPMIIVLADMTIDRVGASDLTTYLAALGGCGIGADEYDGGIDALLQHGGKRDPGTPNYIEQHVVDARLTDNEQLAELAGRKCYNSFGSKIGRGSNAEYIANILGAPGKIPHASVLYHAKMTFFFGGISRRMTHELIRHYVGADRSEEGCPSQESTRYTEHPGTFVAHPRHLRTPAALEQFEQSMDRAYRDYRAYLNDEVHAFQDANNGDTPKGMDRKRIYEAAAAFLPGAASTSMIWTTNPVALQKLFFERTDVAADLEFKRFADALKTVCLRRWPNLFRESNPAAEKAT